MLKFHVQTAPFTEQPTVRETTNEFDIVVTNPERTLLGISVTKKGLHEYCHNLLFKVVSLNKSRIKPFLQYQCEQLDDPFVWLNKLEKLIDLNREGFTTKDHNIKIEKALVVIELLRNEVETGKRRPKRFNFKTVKQSIQRFETPEEKMSYLLEAKTEYLQNKPLIIDPTEVPFEVQCDLEVQLLKTKRKLTKTKNTPLLPGEGRSLANGVRSSETQSPTNQKNRFKINTPINQFVDIFYQLMHEKYINSLPYLEASTNELAELISNAFMDKDGNEISQETIKTILRPSRRDKRPKEHNRIIIT